MREESGESVSIAVNGVLLDGVYRLPDEAEGAVLFACDNRHRTTQPDFLANLLPQNSLATVLVDLLTAAEDALYEDRLDLELLTARLAVVARWINGQSELCDLPLGLFGVGTSGACALRLAAMLGSRIGAVVAWDGRPDLAEEFLALVSAPTLLIVGGKDDLVRDLNQRAYSKLGAEKELVVIPGATHVFEEGGALQAAGERAAEWFVNHLGRANTRSGRGTSVGNAV